MAWKREIANEEYYVVTLLDGTEMGFPVRLFPDRETQGDLHAELCAAGIMVAGSDAPAPDDPAFTYVPSLPLVRRTGWIGRWVDPEYPEIQNEWVSVPESEEFTNLELDMQADMSGLFEDKEAE